MSRPWRWEGVQTVVPRYEKKIWITWKWARQNFGTTPKGNRGFKRDHRVKG